MISNPMLYGAIQVMKAEPTPEHQAMLLTELAKARLITPILREQEAPAGERTEEMQGKTGAAQVKFPMLKGPDGKLFFMAFTDKYELEGWKGDKSESALLTLKEYAGLILREGSNAAGMVLNPFGANMIIPAPMLAAIMSAEKR